MKLGELYRSLVDDDFRLLKLFVGGLRYFEYIPIEYIVKRFEKMYTQKEIVARIRKLTKLGLLARHPSMNSYRITFLGLDCSALKYLVTHGIIKAIDDKIGIGKESEVYKGLNENDEIVAIKFYRIGKQSFKNIAKFRGYYEGMEQSGWIHRSIVAGKREREALMILNKYRVPGVPKIYGGILHCVIIEYIDGVRLNEAIGIDNPQHIFYQVIDIIRHIYRDAGIVHGDLSEYNIMISLRDEKEYVYIIDWPQYTLTTMPIALQLLKRDIENIIKFFRRRYRLNIDLQETLKYVLGE